MPREMGAGERNVVDVEQPLLEEEEKKKKSPALLYPNCPGCKHSYLQDPDAKLPYKIFGTLAALTLVSALPISSLYPFLYFMVRDFNIAKSDKDIGFYAGYVGSSFMVGRFLTSVQWGMVADKYGRVPVMIIGCITVIVFHTLFGASTNFWMAVLARFFLGGLNGMLGTIKAYASEVCSEKHQAISVSIVGTVWGLGLIIGPAMGGYLSQPAIKYPNLFPPGSLFDRYAYLLPSLCVTVISIPTLCITFYLPETIHKHDVKEVEQAEDSKYEKPLSLPIPNNLSRAGSRKYTVCESIESPSVHSPLGSLHEPKFEDAWNQHSEKGPQNSDQVQTRSSSLRSLSQNEEDMNDNDGYRALLGTDTPKDAQVLQINSTDAAEEKIPGAETNLRDSTKKKKSLWTSKPLMASIALYCIWSLHDMAFSEIFSLWCVSPLADGGLGLSTTVVGQILAISGFTMLVFQILFFAPLVNWMGAVLVSRSGAGFTTLSMAAFPLMTMLKGTSLFIVLNLLSIVKNILGILIFTGSFILVNNSVRQDQRGAANGLAMSLVSLFKAVGPAGGGSIFAWAQSRQDTYILPGNQLVFFSLAVVSLITYFTTFEPFLPRSLDRPLPEDRDVE
ncbi:protein ZINC INDUCED FACILITATOR-LIKE 1 isoform X2 [Physcomitrium patens]|uniref:Major facilitator superfamily (MFS) profile domain-containing protein n=2 Tax=Physcomitrium patens TaxID=3218 RepID=A0A2K1J8L8_PHYPA|nr:probable peptide/nitrate transporter At3g43790 isoform X2 [Physcomitrium patens]PNR37866.1 hypothetical protein PHYPA_020975 [Physcomitrium patens]|eukprot:XP_024398714.1 probable peptide/nitrate transporter At3g43790 isoform X2 [Physcomitrella patens]